jgi:hypothetical protein
MKIGVATGDFVEGAVHEDGSQILGGSGHIRIGQYLPYTGHDVTIGELAWLEDDGVFGVRDWWGEDHWEFDLLLFQRWMHKTIPARIKIARGNGQVIVNDLDDWYWGMSEKNLAFQTSHPRVSPDENINHYKKSLGKSDAVIVSTQYLLDRLTKFIPEDRLYLMENHIEIDKFRLWEHTEAEHPVIGWIGSTAHRSGDFDVLKRQYGILEDKSPGVFRYHHSGHIGWHTPFYEKVGLGKDDVTILTPVPSEKLGQLMRFDIGVAPLTNNTFNRAKSWIKGLEYAAAGIPFLASPVEPYLDLKERYNVGWVQHKDAHWEASFIGLKDPEFRKEIASHNLKNIQALDAPFGAAKWDAILIEIVENSKR